MMQNYGIKLQNKAEEIFRKVVSELVIPTPGTGLLQPRKFTAHYHQPRRLK